MSSQSISFKPTSIMRNMSWGIDERRARSFIIFFVSLGLVGGLYVFQSGAVTASALEAATLQGNITTLQRQNDSLRAKIARAESMAVIKQRAIELNLTPTAPANIEYLVVPDLPAVVTTAGTPAKVTATSVQQTSGWLNAIVDWLAGVSK